MGKAKKSFYAVRVGRNTGVYDSWSECQAQVNRYPGAVFKGFSTSDEAGVYVAGGGSTSGARYSGSSIVGGSSVHLSSSSSSSSSRSAAETRERYTGDFTGARYTDYGRRHGCSGSTATSSSAAAPVVYSDGCCYNNGRRGASAGVGVYWGNGSEHNVSEKLGGGQTNQRAELVSACRALEGAISQGHRSVELRTDSSYTINAMTSWLGKWKQNGWKTSGDSEVKNKADLERLDHLCQQVDVNWTHVPGHRGIHGNEAADQLAKAGSHKKLD